MKNQRSDEQAWRVEHKPLVTSKKIRFQEEKDMATAKQYEILFMLKAQIDSAFATGFNNARGYLASMQQEINQYKNVLRDISAYQRTEQALNKLNASIQQNGHATAAQAQKVQDYKNKLQAIERELQNAGVDTSKLTDEQKRLESEMEAVQQQMEEWKQFQNTITDIANAFSVMKMGADLVSNAVGRMNEALGSAISSAGELQYTMSAVRGISGATEEETAALTALAKETGATTIYTASEAAQALQTEALAGWSVNQMLEGMPAVVKLAAASGEDLTSMTSIVSDSLNAFGLSGEASVTRFADVLTKAATSSNTTVSLMGQSLSHVESTAANLGYSIEDVSILLATMANRALKGSVSGTALNTTLTRMSGANKTASDEMDRLNLSMYNADGTAKPLLQFMNELRTAFQQFGDNAQEAQVSAYKLAGQRGMRGLLSIVNASEEEWSRLTEEIYASAGAADSISDIRLDNYRGQVYLLNSAMDALKTSTGEALIPVETYWAKLKTEAATSVNDFVIEHQGLVASLVAGAEGAGVAATAIGGLATAFQGLRYAVTVLSPEMIGMLKIGAGVTGVAAIVGAAAGAYINYCVQAEEESKKLRKEIEGLGEQIESDISSYEEMADGYDQARTKGSDLVDSLERVSNWSDTAAGKNRNLAETVAQLNELYPDLKLSIDETSSALNMPVEDIRSTVNQFGQQEWTDRNAAISTLKSDEEAAKKALEDAQREFDTWQEKARQEMSTSWLGTTSIETGLGAENAKIARDTATAEYERIQQAREEAEKALQEYAVQNTGLETIDLTSDQLSEITELTNAYGDAWSTAYEKAGKALDGIYGLLKEKVEVQETSTSALQENLDAQLEQAQNYQKNLQTIFDAANAQGLDLSPILDELTSGTGEAQAAAQALADSISGGSTASLEGLLNTETELNNTIETIKNTYANQTPEVQAAAQALADALSFKDVNLKEQGVLVAEGVIQGLVEGLENGEAPSAATAQADAMIKALRDATGVHSPSTITYDIGIGIDQGLANGITSTEGTVTSAAGSVASGTISAFKGPLTYSAFYSISYNAFQGAIDAAKKRKDELVKAYREAAQAAKAGFNSTKGTAQTTTTGYATGTVSASTGFRMVGENGPEIIWFNGGEEVSNASQTRELMKTIQEQSRPSVEMPSVSEAISNQESRVLQVTYAPVIQMSGGNETDIEEILRRHEEDLTERLNTWMDERETAMARRGW